MKSVFGLFSILAISSAAFSQALPLLTRQVTSQRDYLDYVKQSAIFAEKHADLLKDANPANRIVNGQELWRMDGQMRLAPQAFVGFLEQALAQRLQHCDLSLTGGLLRIGGDSATINNVFVTKRFGSGTEDPFLIQGRVEFVANLNFGDAGNPSYLHVNLWTETNGTVSNLRLTLIHPDQSDSQKMLASNIYCDAKDDSKNWLDDLKPLQN